MLSWTKCFQYSNLRTFIKVDKIQYQLFFRLFDKQFYTVTYKHLLYIHSYKYIIFILFFLRIKGDTNLALKKKRRRHNMHFIQEKMTQTSSDQSKSYIRPDLDDKNKERNNYRVCFLCKFVIQIDKDFTSHAPKYFFCQRQYFQVVFQYAFSKKLLSEKFKTKIQS